MSDRKTNIELLRIIAMIMVIFHHLTYHCFYPELTDSTVIKELGNEFFSNPIFYKRLLLPETFIPFGKIGDCIFILISGFFLVEKGRAVNLTKSIINLITMSGFATGILMFSSVLYYSFLFPKKYVALLGIDIFNGNWWFVGYYLAVVIVGKFFLNERLLKFNKTQYIDFLVLLFSICSISWIGGLTDNLSSGLRTLICGLFLFAMGGFIKIYDPFRNIRLRLILLVMIGILLVVWLTYYNKTQNAIQNYLRSNQTSPYVQVKSGYADYNIVSIVTGICIFEVFRRVKVPKSGFVNFVAKSTFMVYLIHENDFVRYIWREHNFVGDLAMKPMSYIISMLIYTFVTFLFGVCTYVCYLECKKYMMKFYKK